MGVALPPSFAHDAQFHSLPVFFFQLHPVPAIVNPVHHQPHTLQTIPVVVLYPSGRPETRRSLPAQLSIRAAGGAVALPDRVLPGVSGLTRYDRGLSYHHSP